MVIGTKKGNMLLYDHMSQRRIPVLGKHSKAIRDGAWAEAMPLLALASDDNTVRDMGVAPVKSNVLLYLCTKSSFPLTTLTGIRYRRRLPKARRP